MMAVAGMGGRPLNELYWTASGGREDATESYRLMATQASFSPLVPKREERTVVIGILIGHLLDSPRNAYVAKFLRKHQQSLLNFLQITVCLNPRLRS